MGSQSKKVVSTAQVFEGNSGSRYFNRDLSDLAFIERVLEESSNEQHPLLERLGFLSISASILDQFYTVQARSNVPFENFPA